MDQGVTAYAKFALSIAQVGEGFVSFNGKYRLACHSGGVHHEQDGFDS